MQSRAAPLDRARGRKLKGRNEKDKRAMLERMRAATQGMVGRAIMTIVLGLIVVSFAVWGIGDVFRGFGGNKIASVGGAAITPDEFRNAYQTIMQQYQRQ